MIISRFADLLGSQRVRMSDVHRATGISRTTLRALFYGESGGIEFNTLESICRFLRCSPGDLLVLDSTKEEVDHCAHPNDQRSS